MWKERLADFRRHWRSMFVKVFDLYEVEYNMNIEISEPLDGDDKAPRLHFHGIIEFTTNNAIMEFLLINLEVIKRMSMIKIKPIDDMNKWYHYCKKQAYLPLGKVHHRLKWVDDEEESIDEKLEALEMEIPKKKAVARRATRQVGKGSRAKRERELLTREEIEENRKKIEDNYVVKKV